MVLHMSKQKSFYSIVVAAMMAASCSNDVVPVNARLLITPESHSTNIIEQHDVDDNCLHDASNHVDLPIVLQLTTENGSPIGDTSISVYIDFAANTFSGTAVLSLFDDLNGNGVVDEDTELISAADDSIARVKTDKWTGTRSLLLRVNLSCAFRGEVFAFTGGATGRAVVEVVAQDINKPEVIPEEES